MHSMNRVYQCKRLCKKKRWKKWTRSVPFVTNRGKKIRKKFQEELGNQTCIKGLKKKGKRNMFHDQNFRTQSENVNVFTTKLTLPRHKYAAAMASWASDAVCFKLVFQPVTKMTNGLLELNSLRFHKASGLLNGIDILAFLVFKMNDIESTFGVYFDSTFNEFEFSAAEP